MSAASGSTATTDAGNFSMALTKRRGQCDAVHCAFMLATPESRQPSGALASVKCLIHVTSRRVMGFDHWREAGQTSAARILTGATE
jgi:hypothetical protein